MLQTKMSVGDLERTLICTFVASSQCWDQMGKYFGLALHKDAV